MTSPWTRRILALVAAATLGGCQCQPSLPNNNGKDDPTTSNTDSSTTPTDTGPPPACPVMEVEPNNSVGEANTLPIEVIGCGEISAAGDIDVFVTEVPEEGWVSFDILARRLGSFMDVQMVLTPPSGSAAIRTDDEGTTDASLLFPGTPGSWSIQVAEQNFSGGEDYFYQVVASIAKAPVEWTRAEVEPNDELVDATVVTSGEVLFGDMGVSLDGDWYRLDVPPGRHRVTAEVVAYAEGSAGNFVIYLSDAAQNLLPLGCDPFTTCATRGHPIDRALHDPILEWDSSGNEQLYVKVSEEEFHWGKHTWYVIAFTMEAA